MVAVVWRKLALKQLKEAYVYVKKDSLKSAISLRKEIFDTTEKLSKNPKIYPLDKYRTNNDGSFRAFEVYSYRIAYQITISEVRILRVQHTKREPLNY
ncbi:MULTISPECIES: type II toxin-antitoxin system RelE/ParE family toxin [Winogradskyella]|uniref:type II toxin-antitoxin system RelE/ParE family toxin n=1 Tax=Winogradskyella TaxID=286104 RepID=UPI0015CC94F7|nr:MULTISPECIES: type II toxin-antitoxin system RelE/ParE family toxin [Winogradskyella]QXP80351.1 type II toxin-antitoxin system RelE/ParE family toxin [Winogradskyella sp. HaHa_3_26]